MGFIDSYKKLDNLCKNLLNSNTGITTYIAQMDNLNCANIHVLNISKDYKKLKQYRHIRNKIVHDDGASEKKLCTKEDTKWIEHFYNRIKNKSDPLSICLEQKHKKLRHNSKSSKRKAKTQKSGVLIKIGLFFAVILFLLLLYIFANF